MVHNQYFQVNQSGVLPHTVREEKQDTFRAKLRVGNRAAVQFLALIWVVFAVDKIFFHGQLTYYGIHPHDVEAFPYIFTAPLLHQNFSHILSNSTGVILVWLVALSGRKTFWYVTLWSVLFGGIGTWLIGNPHTIHVGISGVIYGWLSFLLVRGIVHRNWWHILQAIVLFSFFSSMVWGIVPTAMSGISWQGHLCGAVAGISAAILHPHRLKVVGTP